MIDERELDKIEDAREGERDEAPLSDDDLLTFCQNEKNAAISFLQSEVDPSRRQALRDYMQEPYGTEQPGLSQFVTSDVLEIIEWVKPGLLKIFVGTDKVVEFEPTHEDDVDGAKQATDACNYVFFKQNNGFLVLLNCISDMLMYRNCAVMWRTERVRQVEYRTFKALSDMEMVMLTQKLQGEFEKVEMVNASPSEVADEMGQPVQGVFDVRFRLTKTIQKVTVEDFEPDNLLVSASHTSPILDNCTYVGRRMRTTKSELVEMGFDVDDEDLALDRQASELRRLVDVNQTALYRDRNVAAQSDPSQKETDLYWEFVLFDYDGDGIAERRLVIRTPHKILSNEPVEQVQIATASPIIRSHRWDGMSLADLVSSIQRLNTEITRQMLDSLYLANNPRTAVLTMQDGSIQANLDDLLDSRPGGVVREYQPNATRPMLTQWVGGQSMPMLEHIQSMKERKTGVTSYNQGVNADSLNKTATGITNLLARSDQRVELIARVIAECLIKPIMKGVLRLLTQGGMEKIAFRLDGKFVQYDPNEWRDQYDTTINVGLGTGNKDQMLAHLMQIAQSQAMAVQAGFMGVLVTPKQLYHTQAKIVENAGFKDVGNFWMDPEQVPPQPPKPNPEVEKMQAQAQLEQQKAQLDIQKTQAQLAHDKELAQMKIQADLMKEEMKQRAETERSAQTLKNQRVLAAAQPLSEEGDFSVASIAQAVGKLAEENAAINNKLAVLPQALSEIAAIAGAEREAIPVKDPFGKTIGARSRIKAMQ